VRRRATYGYVARFVLVLALIVWTPQEALAIAFTVYALSAPVRVLLRWRTSTAVARRDTLSAP